MTLLRWWRLAGVVAVLALLAAPALPGAAGGRVLGHAQLVTSSPGAASVVEEPPDELRLLFSEPLEAEGSSVDVIAADGTRVLTHAGAIDPDDPYALVVEAPELADGIYQVRWRSLSSADGHAAEGAFTFGVGVPGLPTAPSGDLEHSEANPVHVAARTLTYPGLLLAAGIPIFQRVVLRRESLTRVAIRVLAALLALSGIATVVLAVLWAIEAGSIGGYLLGRNGLLQLARAAVTLAGAALLLVLPVGRATVAAAAAGTAGIVLLVLAGHAAALPSPAPFVAGVVHVLGAAIWTSGVAVLVLLLLRPQLLTGIRRRPEMRTIVPRFSAMALVSIGLVGLSGVYATWAHTGTLVPIGTSWGNALLSKSVLAGAALGLGGLNYLDGGRMGRWMLGIGNRISAESVLIAVVLVATAWLALTPPTDEPHGVAIEPIPNAFGGLLPDVGMQVVPGRTGLNRISIDTTDAMATGNVRMELVLSRLDSGESSRIPLRLGGDTGGHGGHSAVDSPGLAEWVADAVVLPQGSEWDASLVASSSAGEELARQRFAFAMGEETVVEGRAETLLDPATAVALALVVGGALGLGLGLGGLSLPRCEPVASRVALLGGGAAAVVLGVIIGVDRLVT